MNKFPSFQFYVKDFICDGKVEAMDTFEVGAYILLLCKAWHEDPVGSIPNNDTTLQRWCRCGSKMFKSRRDNILSPFQLKEDNRYYQKRMVNIHKELLQFSLERSESGKRGAEIKKLRLSSASSLATQELQANASSSVSSLQTPITPISPKGEYSKKLLEKYSSEEIQTLKDSLWNLFNRKDSTLWHEKELKALERLSKITPEEIELIRWFRKDSGANYYRKDLQTTLNNFQMELERAQELKEKQEPKSNQSKSIDEVLNEN